VCGGGNSACMHINWICHTNSKSDSYLFIRNLEIQLFSKMLYYNLCFLVGIKTLIFSFTSPCIIFIIFVFFYLCTMYITMFMLSCYVKLVFRIKRLTYRNIILMLSKRWSLPSSFFIPPSYLVLIEKIPEAIYYWLKYLTMKNFPAKIDNKNQFEYVEQSWIKVGYNDLLYIIGLSKSSKYFSLSKKIKLRN